MDTSRSDDVRGILARDRGRKRPGRGDVHVLHLVPQLDEHEPVDDAELIDDDEDHNEHLDEQHLVHNKPDNVIDVVLVPLDDPQDLIDLLRQLAWPTEDGRDR